MKEAQWHPPAWQDIEESALVTQAREGDTTAFAELVRRYEGKIFRLAQHITQNREDAEDVLQESFMKAYEHLEQFKGDSKFYTWIVRIAVNQALMKLRRRKTDKSVSLDETIDTGEDTVVREIAAWGEDPEQSFSREELGEYFRYRNREFGASLPKRFRPSRHRRTVDGRNSRSTWTFGSRREEQVVEGPVATSGEADTLLQTQGRRRVCLHVRTF